MPEPNTETKPNVVKFDNAAQIKEFIAEAVTGAVKDIGLQKPPSANPIPTVSATEPCKYKNFADFMSHVVSKDVYEGSTTSGGYAVPDVYASALYDKFGFINPFYNHANVVQVNTNSWKLPVVDIDTFSATTTSTSDFGGMRMDIVADGSAPTEGSINWKQITATPFIFRGTLQASNEWLRDVNGGSELLMNIMAEKMALTSAYYSINGTGTGEHEGSLNAGMAVSTAARATASKFADADAMMMLAKLSPNFNPARVFWLVSNAMAGELLSISDKANYLTPANTSLKPGFIGSLWNFPVYISPWMPAANTTGDVQLVDGGKCYLVQGQAPTVAASTEYAFTSGLITYRFEFREDQRFNQDTYTTWPNSVTTSGVVKLLTK